MSLGSEDAVASEIIIVKRRGNGGDAGHKGGAWKIAFADFMTAMMALFLVLWLTNSTDEATKKQIATYFNPLKLTDSKAVPKGLKVIEEETAEEQADQPFRVTNMSTATEANKQSSFENRPSQSSEQLFRDPYDLIRRLSQEASQSGNIKKDASSGGQAGGPAVEQGTAFRDPFDPVFRSEVLEQDETRKRIEANAEVKAALQQSRPSQGAAADQIVSVSEDPTLEQNSDSKAKADRKAKKEHKKKQTNEAKKIASGIAKAIQKNSVPAVANIAVAVEDGGILISLTDKADFGMFTSASALPGPELVELMTSIGQVLQKTPGQIIVRGHTDGRPFRTPDNDNWRLSMGRAYSAHSMLLGAGIEARRFAKIEGFADRQLRDKKNVGAAVNRRIEILVRPEEG